MNLDLFSEEFLLESKEIFKNKYTIIFDSFQSHASRYRIFNSIGLIETVYIPYGVYCFNIIIDYKGNDYFVYGCSFSFTVIKLNAFENENNKIQYDFRHRFWFYSELNRENEILIATVNSGGETFYFVMDFSDPFNIVPYSIKDNQINPSIYEKVYNVDHNDFMPLKIEGDVITSYLLIQKLEPNLISNKWYDEFEKFRKQNLHLSENDLDKEYNRIGIENNFDEYWENRYYNYDIAQTHKFKIDKQNKILNLIENKISETERRRIDGNLAVSKAVGDKILPG